MRWVLMDVGAVSLMHMMRWKGPLLLLSLFLLFILLRRHEASSLHSMVRSHTCRLVMAERYMQLQWRRIATECVRVIDERKKEERYYY